MGVSVHLCRCVCRCVELCACVCVHVCARVYLPDNSLPGPGGLWRVVLTQVSEGAEGCGPGPWQQLPPWGHPSVRFLPHHCPLPTAWGLSLVRFGVLGRTPLRQVWV